MPTTETPPTEPEDAPTIQTRVVIFALYNALMATAPWLISWHDSHPSKKLPWLGTDGRLDERWLGSLDEPQLALDSYAVRSNMRELGKGPHADLLQRPVVQR